MVLLCSGCSRINPIDSSRSMRTVRPPRSPALLEFDLTLRGNQLAGARAVAQVQVSACTDGQCQQNGETSDPASGTIVSSSDSLRYLLGFTAIHEPSSWRVSCTRAAIDRNITSSRMRSFTLTLALLAGSAAPARPTSRLPRRVAPPPNHMLKGWASVSACGVGFEFEYAHLSEETFEQLTG